MPVSFVAGKYNFLSTPGALFVYGVLLNRPETPFSLLIRPSSRRILQDFQECSFDL